MVLVLRTKLIEYTDLFLLGYGDLSATNVQEMLYAIVVMVVGKLLFGFILGSIASTLANLETQKVQFEEKLSAIKVSMCVAIQCVIMYASIFLLFFILPSILHFPPSLLPSF